MHCKRFDASGRYRWSDCQGLSFERAREPFVAAKGWSTRPGQPRISNLDLALCCAVIEGVVKEHRRAASRVGEEPE